MLEVSDLGCRGIALSSKNKGADQLHDYQSADLRLCFRICKKHVFSCCCSNNIHVFMIIVHICIYLVKGDTKPKRVILM